MEIIFEALFEFYFELMMLIVPIDKTTSTKYRLLYVLIALLDFFGCLALFIWGILLIDGGNMLGWIPFFAALILSGFQIAAGCILYVKRNKK